MKKFGYIIISVLLVQACRSEPSSFEEPTIPGEGADRIEISMATRSIDIDDQYPYGKGEDEETPYFFDKFEDDAIIYISQQGTSESPNLYYNSDDNSLEALTPDCSRSNLYVYQYESNSGADWDTGYNFIPYTNKSGKSKALDWGEIRTRGSRGNAFWFYALYQGNSQPNFRINGWQNNDNNIGGSAKSLALMHDLMGAYHASSSLYTRMRFKLYHLTVLTHVTLLVPVYQAEQNGHYSGFDENAFDNNSICGLSSYADLPGVWYGVPAWANRQYSASQNGFNNNFKIDWEANRSSDNEAPLAIVGTTGANNPCFYMLKNTPKEPFELKDVKSFYPGANIETDMVRRYEFITYTTIQPAKRLPNALLSIRLLTPGSDTNVTQEQNGSTIYYTMKNGTYVGYFYYGDTNKNQNQLTSGDELDYTTQGIYQHLTLYLPRQDNKTILVSAKVEPWNETHTDMTLVPREDETSDD